MPIEVRLRKKCHATTAVRSECRRPDNFIKDAQHALNIMTWEKIRKVKAVKKKTEIFAEGDAPLNVYFIKSGERENI
jgi:hypothetical protein